MQIDIVTIFPDFFAGPLDYGIVRRAREAQLVAVRVHDLRSYTHDRHRTVDDRPFGGGEGMVLKPEPLFEAVESLLGEQFRYKSAAGSVIAGTEFTGNPSALPSKLRVNRVNPSELSSSLRVNKVNDPGDERAPLPWDTKQTAIVLLSASGKLFRQETAQRLALLDRMILLCGRYEGVDERVAEHLATDEISVGDYVLSGGELAAALIMDAVTRLIPGALGNEDSSVNESFSAVDAPDSLTELHAGQPPAFVGGQGKPIARQLLLDFPHYTRPAEFRGWPVPEVLLGGNHSEIRRWRAQKALEKTRRNRPDLLTE